MAFKEISSDQKLITLVEEFPNLYNKRDKTYKDESEKQKSWMSIACRMNVDVAIVRKRWDNLRDRFVRSYREYTDSVTSEIEKDIKFSLFYQMLWLAQFIRKRKCNPLIPSVPQKPNEIKQPVKYEFFYYYFDFEFLKKVYWFTFCNLPGRVTRIQVLPWIVSYHVTSTSLQNVKTSAIGPPDTNTWCEYFNDEANKSFQDDDSIKQFKHENSSENSEERKIMDMRSVIMHPPSVSSTKKLKKDHTEPQSDPAESSFIKIFEKTISSDTDQSDFNFMMSIVADMKHINKKKKMKFKREVLELLEKYVD